MGLPGSSDSERCQVAKVLMAQFLGVEQSTWCKGLVLGGSGRCSFKELEVPMLAQG